LQSQNFIGNKVKLGVIGDKVSSLEAKMLSYAKVQNKPRVLQSLSGLTVVEFEQLLVSFEQAWQGYVEQH
jgi:hypothetical protein